MLAYSNSLDGTWAMDDVVANKPVGIGDIKDIAGFRKVASLTFSINHYLAPFSPAYFRLFNILIHIFNSLLIYLLAYRTMTLMSAGAADKKKNLPPGDEDIAFYTAFAASMLFALHPLNINAVAYIVQRMASLAAMFVLLSLVFYITASFSVSRLRAASSICSAQLRSLPASSPKRMPLWLCLSYFSTITSSSHGSGSGH